MEKKQDIETRNKNCKYYKKFRPYSHLNNKTNFPYTLGVHALSWNNMKLMSSMHITSLLLYRKSRLPWKKRDFIISFCKMPNFWVRSKNFQDLSNLSVSFLSLPFFLAKSHYKEKFQKITYYSYDKFHYLLCTVFIVLTF